MKSLFVALCVCVVSISLSGQGFYEAYLTNDLSAWQAGVSQLERSYEQSADPDILLAMAKGAYGAIGTSFAQQDMEVAAEWVEKAETYTKAYLEKNDNSAEANALLAGIYGMKIGLKPMRGMTLGPKSGRLLSKATTIDPECALAHYVTGTSAYNTPETWGGSISDARMHFEKAKSLYETHDVAENWEYLNTLAWLGQAQMKLGEYTAAKATFEHALSVEPNFGWVKGLLLPKVQAQLAKNGQ